jgi:hypothetical protein
MIRLGMLCAPSAWESEVVRKSVIVTLCFWTAAPPLCALQRKEGVLTFELKQKLEMLHFHSSLFHWSVYTMHDTDRCLKLVFFFELKTGMTQAHCCTTGVAA